ncbi:RES family NAD+ phosphorylase [Oceaniovalibus sp. ACAM 378]|uniref:RES family NAD+ phosphorylase n=1 Tax=Oceaniovalibus sp. ACAM 378 TaxID=2599923 RepID=UPI0011D566CE|nr:RES family NAD+ phosphorylase [Oceaniovalibus sp. ACAM 378]TYB85358.1 RES domain-containing protein [Oceaniovalibus sp. ACAM 378]
MPLDAGRFRGSLFRALNPVYAREPLSGRGAEIYGGRFNPKGTPALYCSLDPATALREANQAGSLQPTVLVSYRADLGPIFDTRDQSEMSRYPMSGEALSDPGWRSAMLDGRPVPTQDFAKALVLEGYGGLLVRSFATGTTSANLNLVLWTWQGDGFSLKVVDDEDRLGRM